MIYRSIFSNHFFYIFLICSGFRTSKNFLQNFDFTDTWVFTNSSRIILCIYYLRTEFIFIDRYWFIDEWIRMWVHYSTSFSSMTKQKISNECQRSEILANVTNSLQIFRFTHFSAPEFVFRQKRLQLLLRTKNLSADT